MRLAESELVEVMNVALPRLGLEPAGYRRLKSTLRKRLSRRMGELGLSTGRDYLARLQTDAQEWTVLDALCRMSISRFYRDAAVFEELGRSHLPRLAARARNTGRQRISAWSAGCASGEEAYSVALLWHFVTGPAHPGLELHILASDADPLVLERARRARYAPATLRELPAHWRARAFETEGDALRLGDDIRTLVHFESRDLRHSVPNARFDLILCRNSAFTYFDPAAQRLVAERSWSVLETGGVLVLGVRERLPEPAARPWLNPSPGVYIKPT